MMGNDAALGRFCGPVTSDPVKMGRVRRLLKILGQNDQNHTTRVNFASFSLILPDTHLKGFLLPRNLYFKHQRGRVLRI